MDVAFGNILLGKNIVLNGGGISAYLPILQCSGCLLYIFLVVGFVVTAIMWMKIKVVGHSFVIWDKTAD
jgi:hypothetical protein